MSNNFKKQIRYLLDLIDKRNNNRSYLVKMKDIESKGIGEPKEVAISKIE